MTMYSPATAGRGLRGWGGGLFLLGIVILVASVLIGVLGARNVNVDDLDFASEGTATLTSEQVVVVRGSSANDCVVTGPSGVALPYGPSSGQINDLYFVSLVPIEDGPHTIACQNGAAFAFADQDLVSSAGGGVVAVIGAFVGALIGGFFILLGFILWLVGRSKRKNALRNAQQYNGGGYDAPPPPGYSQY
ncbi:hypothetical protein K0651_11120 [Ornithinimicrobium sp. Arc0846-15]|nr:hypothetical protein [Ornithinimicrobium laminariae]